MIPHSSTASAQLAVPGGVGLAARQDLKNGPTGATSETSEVTDEDVAIIRALCGASPAGIERWLRGKWKRITRGRRQSMFNEISRWIPILEDYKVAVSNCSRDDKFTLLKGVEVTSNNFLVLREKYKKLLNGDT